MEPLGVGLHIIYGRMGAGKSNFAVSKILRSSTYKKVVLNIPLFPEFRDTLDKEIIQYKKLEPEKVIRDINEEHQDTLFIVDEAQMVLLSANKLLVDSFVKKMSQIRQNNQCCVVIAQISKMLPQSIKDLAESCYFFENNNVKGIEKSSKVKHYRTGYDYSTRIIEEFTYLHEYGLYETSNTPTTEKPKNLYKRTYFKMVLIFGAALLLFIFVGYKFYVFFNRFSDDEETQGTPSQIETSFSSSPFLLVDSRCVRSWNHLKNGVVQVMFEDGQMEYKPISQFVELKKCSLFEQTYKIQTR